MLTEHENKERIAQIEKEKNKENAPQLPKETVAEIKRQIRKFRGEVVSVKDVNGSYEARLFPSSYTVYGQEDLLDVEVILLHEVNTERKSLGHYYSITDIGVDLERKLHVTFSEPLIWKSPEPVDANWTGISPNESPYVECDICHESFHRDQNIVTRLTKRKTCASCRASGRASEALNEYTPFYCEFESNGRKCGAFSRDDELAKNGFAREPTTKKMMCAKHIKIFNEMFGD